MNDLINKMEKGTKIKIKEEVCTVNTKTWYSIEEDPTASYIKCELDNGKVLVVIPDDELIYVGKVINNMNYIRESDDTLNYEGRIFNKTGDGHQYVTRIEFGDKDEVEGKCIFEDFESENNIISLGILPDKDNIRADVYADIIDVSDIELI